MNALIRMIALLLVACTATIAAAVPARPLYEPEPLPKLPTGPNLAGTTWVGKLYTEGEKVTFFADGTLRYGDVVGGSPGSWKLEGDQLYFEINKYSEYKTTIRGDVIDGIGWNKGGQETKPFLRLQGSAMPPVELPPAKPIMINRR